MGREFGDGIVMGAERDGTERCPWLGSTRDCAAYWNVGVLNIVVEDLSIVSGGVEVLILSGPGEGKDVSAMAVEDSQGDGLYVAVEMDKYVPDMNFAITACAGKPSALTTRRGKCVDARQVSAERATDAKFGPMNVIAQFRMTIG